MEELLNAGGPGIHLRQLGAASGASGSDVKPAARSHPSSRAGGQDDVSSKQTPSNDVLTPLERNFGS